MKAFLEAGKIVGTHGVRGELRVQPWCDSPDFLAGFKTFYFDPKGKNAVTAESARAHGNLVLLRLNGVESIEQASLLRNKILYISRADAKIDENGWFVQDLMGCIVFDAVSGANLGELTDVSRTGANDVWHVTKDEREYLIPAIPDVIKSVDVVGGIIKITPLKGIFDDED